VALDVYAYRIRKYIGAYAAALGRLDAIVFTAGVGENDARMRALVLEGLEQLGIVLAPERNLVPPPTGVITTDDSRVAALVVPTNEELEIARAALSLL
jgi:acetate kinase